MRACERTVLAQCQGANGQHTTLTSVHHARKNAVHESQIACVSHVQSCCERPVKKEHLHAPVCLLDQAHAHQTYASRYHEGHMRAADSLMNLQLSPDEDVCARTYVPGRYIMMHMCAQDRS